MASILPFNRKAGTVFDDRITEIMGEAFDRACEELHDTGQPSIVYEVIARRIIDATGIGERDPVRLCAMSAWRRFGRKATINRRVRRLGQIRLD